MMCPSFAEIPPKEGVGNAGRTMHPQPGMHEAYLVTTGSPTAFRSNGFTPVLSPVTGLFATVVRFPRIAPASGRQDHTTSPSTLVSDELRVHVHRIPPRS